MCAFRGRKSRRVRNALVSSLLLRSAYRTFLTGPDRTGPNRTEPDHVFCCRSLSNTAGATIAVGRPDRRGEDDFAATGGE